MAAKIGEFEHLVLLALANHEGGATALEIRTTLEGAGRRTSRGALYVTLDRLEEKGMLEWQSGGERPARGGIPAREAAITAEGVRVLREHREVVRNLTFGTGPLFEGP